MEAARRDPPPHARTATHLAACPTPSGSPQHEGRPVRRTRRPQGGGVRVRSPGDGPRARRRRPPPPDLPAPAAGFVGFRPYCPYTTSGTASGRPHLAMARRLVKRSGTRGTHVVVPSPDILDRSGARGHGPHAAPARLQRIAACPPECRTTSNPGRHSIGVQIGEISVCGRLPVPDDLLRLFTCASIRRGTPINTNTSQFCDPTMDRLTAEAKQLQVTDPTRGRGTPGPALSGRIVDQAPLVAAYNSPGPISLPAGSATTSTTGPGAGLLDQFWVREGRAA